MTKSAALLCFVLAAGGASAQNLTSYPPRADAAVPTFVNAHIVRVDPAARTLTFRSESSDAVLTVEGDALASLSRWHAGDKVLLGYRTVVDSRGREVRIVTELRP